MTRALVFLKSRSLANWTRVQALKLRQPKALAGIAFAAAYFWFFFFRRGLGSVSSLAGAGSPGGAVFQALVPLALTLVLLTAWVLPGDEPAISFRESEISFLFTAPWSRRSLIVYKIGSTLFASFVSAFFLALLFTGRLLFAADGVLVLFAWAVAIAAISLNRIAASLTLHRVARLGLAARGRRWLIVAAVGAAIAVAGIEFQRGQQWIAAAPDNASWLNRIFGLPPLSWLLVPADVVLYPFHAAPLGAIAVGAAVITGFAAWILVLECPFEEASVDAAKKVAARVAMIQRTGRISAPPKESRRTPFPIARARIPELAFLWKNLIAAGKLWLSPRRWAMTAAVLVGLTAVLTHLMGNTYWKAGGTIATVGTFTIWYALIQGPLVTRLDLRHDLGNLDILRAYPLPGWRIMLGELLGPTATLTGIVWLGILAWYLGLHGHQPPKLSLVWFSPPMRIVISGVAAFVTPFLLFVELVIPNLAATLFPQLFRMGAPRSRGFDQMGQRMIFGFAQVLALILILAAPAAAGWAITYVLHLLWGPGASLVTGTIVGVLLLTCEATFGVWILGKSFDQMRP